MAYDVFVSYSANDQPAAHAICAKLESRGIRCWIAPRDIRPGMSWGSAILGAIDDARMMVLVFSRHANTSPQVGREVERAVHKELIIIPVRIEDVQPAGDLEYFLGTPHWLDAMTPPLEQHLDRIVASVNYWLRRGTATIITPGVRSPFRRQPETGAHPPILTRQYRPRQIFKVATPIVIIVIIGILGFLGMRYYWPVPIPTPLPTIVTRPIPPPIPSPVPTIVTRPTPHPRPTHIRHPHRPTPTPQYTAGIPYSFSRPAPSSQPSPPSPCPFGTPPKSWCEGERNIWASNPRFFQVVPDLLEEKHCGSCYGITAP
jgi:hypothetical protein